MIARSIEIDRDPLAPSFGEDILLAAKRGGIMLAVCALALGVLDIAGIHSVAEASKAWDNSSVTAASVSDTIRSGVKDISITPTTLSFTTPDEGDSVIVPIPQDLLRQVTKGSGKDAGKDIGKISSIVAPASKNAVTPAIAQLSAAGSQDALQMAMTPPTILRAERSLIEPVSLPRMETPAPAATSKLAALAAYASTDSSLPMQPSLAERSISASMDATIPLSEVPLPRAAPGLPPPSPAERLGLVGNDKEYARSQRCLANAIYFEARSEPVRGQMAVAQVVVNRAFSGFYPEDICGVVYQNAQRHLACQFTFACDGKRKVINERGNWARANRIAKQTLDGQIYLPEVGKSTHYHAAYVRPNWVHEMRKLARYGLHSFYRPYAWGNGAEDPVWGTAAMAQASAKEAGKKK